MAGKVGTKVQWSSGKLGTEMHSHSTTALCHVRSAAPKSAKSGRRGVSGFRDRERAGAKGSPSPSQNIGGRSPGFRG